MHAGWSSVPSHSCLVALFPDRKQKEQSELELSAVLATNLMAGLWV
jgi:hypothetical protein